MGKILTTTNTQFSLFGTYRNELEMAASSLISFQLYTFIYRVEIFQHFMQFTSNQILTRSCSFFLTLRTPFSNCLQPLVILVQIVLETTYFIAIVSTQHFESLQVRGNDLCYSFYLFPDIMLNQSCYIHVMGSTRKPTCKENHATHIFSISWQFS